MIPVYQMYTVARDGKGDCFNACVSSILGIPLTDTHHILPGSPGVWFLNWRKWLKAQGYSLMVCSKLVPPPGYSIVTVETERRYPTGHHKEGEAISHACVALDGVIVHDPLPGASGIYDIKHYYSITPFDPDEDDD